MVCLDVVDIEELVLGVLVMPLRRWEPAMVPLMRCCLELVPLMRCEHWSVPLIR